ncbi:RNA-binding (RRM/RBD/RNP motifs) family protein [Actinidia rufa]|uniref:RNA-binding (RRM/RBD/RNP motifs) family protein n=1 Tax=Actinidia rufa TaxID=165716 RepID=A0A7J0EPL6_9ERIC|nr:RNA-binding (RRM/RBD/RNP motifs) family protein [Actinidia rufa]
MNPAEYTAAEVIGLPPHATEKDVYEFFAFCGTIEHIDIVRAGEYACSAYVTFKEAYALETAVLLSPLQGDQFVPSAGEAVAMAQDVVKTMLTKGYVLGKDALSKAKSLDESHQVSTTAVAKAAELSERIGLTDKFCTGVEAVMSVDEKYHIFDATKSAVSATGRKAVSAANTLVNSSCFSKGALWISDALNRAAKIAADAGTPDAKSKKSA